MLGTDPDKVKMLESLYREHYQKMFLYARAAFRNSALAEDAVQETFRIACGKQDQVLTSANPVGWLMVTLKNVIRNENRTQKKLQSILQQLSKSQKVSADFPPESDISVNLKELLSPAELELLWCIVIEEYSYAEASSRFGITLETCKKRVYRTKKLLREKMEK